MQNFYTVCEEKRKGLNDYSWDQIASMFGYNSGESARCKYKRYRKKNNIDYVSTKNTQQENIVSKTKVEREQIRQEKNELQKFIRQYATFENIVEKIKTSIEELDSFPTPKIKHIHINNNRELVAMVSDIHLGELCDIEPINKFDSEIIKKRLVKYFGEISAIAKEHNIKKINIALLGDLITNYNIFNSQLSQIDIDPIEQIMQLSEILSSLINQLAFDFVVDIHYCWGNHGKVSYSLSDTTNFEKLIVEFIKLRLQNNKNVKVFDSNGYWAIMNVLGNNYLLIHGDGIRANNMNFAYKYKDIIDSIGVSIDEILMGHFHHSIEKELFASGFGILGNGSFSGGNDHSLKKLQVVTPPSQTCFVVEEGIGRRATYRVRL